MNIFLIHLKANQSDWKEKAGKSPLPLPLVPHPHKYKHKSHTKIQIQKP